MFNIVMTVWLFHSLSTLVLFAVFGVDACRAMLRRGTPRVANSVLITVVNAQVPASANRDMRRDATARFPDTRAA